MFWWNLLLTWSQLSVIAIWIKFHHYCEMSSWFKESKYYSKCKLENLAISNCVLFIIKWYKRFDICFRDINYREYLFFHNKFANWLEILERCNFREMHMGSKFRRFWGVTAQLYLCTKLDLVLIIFILDWELLFSHYLLTINPLHNIPPILIPW